jgi:Holliday junction resolvase RusA-like endonuclease
MNEIRFRVDGTPIPKGSLKAFVPKGWTRAVLTNDNTKMKAWASVITYTVAQVAHAAGWVVAPPDEALEINAIFYMPRPKGHFGSGKNVAVLKASAQQHHVSKPDRDKLLRGLCDALKGVIYTDDSQLVDGATGKRYTDAMHAPGVEVIVRRLNPSLV